MMSRKTWMTMNDIPATDAELGICACLERVLNPASVTVDVEAMRHLRLHLMEADWRDLIAQVAKYRMDRECGRIL